MGIEIPRRYHLLIAYGWKAFINGYGTSDDVIRFRRNYKMKRHSKYWCPLTPTGMIVIGVILFVSALAIVGGIK